jgi:hypothetical protein
MFVFHPHKHLGSINGPLIVNLLVVIAAKQDQVLIPIATA